MAHLLYSDGQDRKTEKRLTLPNIEGRFGLSFYVGKKELFLGVQVTDTIMETVVRKRMVKNKKGKVNVYKFD